MFLGSSTYPLYTCSKTTEKTVREDRKIGSENKALKYVFEFGFNAFGYDVFSSRQKQRALTGQFLAPNRRRGTWNIFKIVTFMFIEENRPMVRACTLPWCHSRIQIPRDLRSNEGLWFFSSCNSETLCNILYHTSQI